jgi:hypothetical protein
MSLEAYRSPALTGAQFRRLLGFETRMQVDAFLKEHAVYDYTAADFETIGKRFSNSEQETFKRWASSRPTNGIQRNSRDWF